MKTQRFRFAVQIPIALFLAAVALDAGVRRSASRAAPTGRQFSRHPLRFSCRPDCTEIGKNTTREMIENIIDLVHPDYLQIDCKGHRGLSSYPTRVGIQRRASSATRCGCGGK